MGRYAILLLLVAALAGCGKQEEAVVITDPVAEALAFAPADAPALAVVTTDASGGPGAAVASLVTRFPGASLVLGQVQQTLGRRLGLEDPGVLGPVSGNPAVAWVPTLGARAPTLAWVASDERKLGDVLDGAVEDRTLARGEDRGEFSLFTVRAGGVLARRGPVVVLAPEAASLRAALDRRASGRGAWTRALVRERSLGLAEGAAARILLDAGAVVGGAGAGSGGAGGSGATGPGGALLDPLVSRAVPLRRLPWVAAFERAALTVSAEAGGLRLHARVGTREVAAEDVPIAPGVEPPSTRGSAPVVAAVRGPRQTLEFARRASDLLDPKRLDGLRRVQGLLGRYAGIDLQEDLFDRLTGTATLTTRDGRLLTLRSDLDDPGRVSDALERLGRIARFGGPLAGLVGVDLGGFSVDEDDGRYELKQDGDLLVALQVVDGALVASTDPAADLVAAGGAAGPARSLPTAGAFRASLSAELLKDRLVAALGLPDFIRGALGPLGAPIVTARGERDAFDLQLVVPVAG